MYFIENPQKIMFKFLTQIEFKICSENVTRYILLYLKQGGEVGFGALLLCKLRLQLSAAAVLRNSVDITIKRLSGSLANRR